MADHHGLGGAHFLDQRDHVAHHVEQRVALDVGRRIGAP
jgi:hypothetical protein